MTPNTFKVTRTQAAIIAGFSLLLMAILAAAANFGVIEPNSHDLAAFAANRPLLFGAALLALILVVVLDIVVAWALHQLFRHEAPALSTLTAWFRTGYAAVFLVAIATLSVLTRLPRADTGEISNLPYMLFNSIWDAGLLLFGVHLLLLAALLVRISFTPGWLGALIAVAGAGYVADTVIQLMAPGSAVSIGTYTFFGEIVLFIWLLVRARRLPFPSNVAD